MQAPSVGASPRDELDIELWRQLDEVNSSIARCEERITSAAKPRDETPERLDLIDLDDVHCSEQRHPIFSIARVLEDNQLPALLAIRVDLEHQRNSIRAEINARARPRLRPLKVVDLPDELLLRVFEYVRGDIYDADTLFSGPERGDTGQIKKLRLTCRRFRDTSSRLLLQYIKVHVTKQSLARLEEVSRHPSISRGLRGIYISLEYYSPVLAEDVRAFSERNASKLSQVLKYWKNGVQRRWGQGTGRFEIFKKAIGIASPMLEAWTDIAENGVAEDDGREGTAVLLRAHRQYQQRCAEQMALRDGVFVHAIASAMAQLPAVTWMSIRDMERSCARRWPSFGVKAMNNPALLQDCLTVPFEGWEEARRFHTLDDAPAELLSGLLVAAQQSGICLMGLEIGMPPPMAISRLLPTDNDYTGFHVATKHLTVVDLHLRTIWDAGLWHLREAGEWGPFITFLSTLLNSAYLRGISLDLSFLWNDSIPPIVSMGPVLFSHDWPVLEELSFYGPFHLEEIRKLAAQVGNKFRLELGGYLSK